MQCKNSCIMRLILALPAKLPLRFQLSGTCAHLVDRAIGGRIAALVMFYSMPELLVNSLSVMNDVQPLVWQLLSSWCMIVPVSGCTEVLRVVWLRFLSLHCCCALLCLKQTDDSPIFKETCIITTVPVAFLIKLECIIHYTGNILYSKFSICRHLFRDVTL